MRWQRQHQSPASRGSLAAAQQLRQAPSPHLLECLLCKAGLAHPPEVVLRQVSRALDLSSQEAPARQARAAQSGAQVGKMRTRPSGLRPGWQPIEMPSIQAAAATAAAAISPRQPAAHPPAQWRVGDDSDAELAAEGDDLILLSIPPSKHGAGGRAGRRAGGQCRCWVGGWVGGSTVRGRVAFCRLPPASALCTLPYIANHSCTCAPAPLRSHLCVS